jgi:hypothetical protein
MTDIAESGNDPRVARSAPSPTGAEDVAGEADGHAA